MHIMSLLMVQVVLDGPDVPNSPDSTYVID